MPEPTTVTYPLETILKEITSKLDTNQSETNSKFDAMQRDINFKFDAMQRDINSKFDAMQRDTNAKLDTVQKDINSKFDTVQKDIDSKLDVLQKDVGELKIKAVRLEEKIDGIDKRLEKVETTQEVLVKDVADLKGAKSLIVPIVVSVITAIATLLIRSIPIQ